uniref:EF-hand domain-containing protein n=1 Tax=Angiostrongylus cantonensis TaxID=6313 RepID=A0A0K0CW15_ANGCA
LTSWVERSMVSLDNEEVTERLTEMDTDGRILFSPDSSIVQVSWEEYLADSFPDRDIKNLDADDKKLMNEDELYFKAADLDGDGKLNMEELSAFLNPENYKHMHKTLITMSEKDLNKDGAIDLKEFLGEMADNDHSEWHAVESNRFMTEYDSDGDGVLRDEEVRRWMIPDVKAIAKQEATHLINGADVDKVRRTK